MSVCHALVEALNRHSGTDRGRGLLVSVARHTVSVTVMDITHHFNIVVLKHSSVLSCWKSTIITYRKLANLNVINT